jgi:ribosomal-protein-alanine N-acetyltransferase
MEFAMTAIVFTPIETSRLLLSDISFDNLNDAHRIYDLYCKPEVHEYLAHNPPATFEEEILVLLKQKINIQNALGLVWWIRKKSQPGIIIGAISLGVSKENSLRGGMGYWLDPQEWNKGYMSECVKSIIQFGFQSGLKSLEIRAFEPNKGSQQVATKCGFTLDGILRESFKKGDQMFDIHVYTLLKSEYNP